MDTTIIERFLESVGQKADVDLYLKLFRGQRKESFAIIAAEASVVREALDSFHFDLRILAGLGLHPVVVLGLFESQDAEDNAQKVHEWLAEDHVEARILRVGKPPQQSEIQQVRETLAAQQIPLVSLSPAGATVDSRFAALEKLAVELGTRKVIFLGAGAGLEKHGSPHISVVNLETDFDGLVNSPTLSRRRQLLLRKTKGLLQRAPHRMTAAVASPLQLLRELFTVNGAGTLIRMGSRVDHFASLGQTDETRLKVLIESAFGRPLTLGALDKPWIDILVEENYRGAALVCDSPAGHYLSKFAVDRAAQGEGIGGDLWDTLTARHQKFFWRSRPDNRICNWYVRKCDGLFRTEKWHVFWRGMQSQDVAAAIEHALAQPTDL